MKIWIWGDNHFNHTNIIKYADRPFKSVEDMNWRMINHHNDLVSEDDLVIFLGDLTLVSSKYEKPKEIMDKLKKTKRILVMGNHDRKSYSYYMKSGFDFVTHKFVWDYMGKKILFVHDPNDISKYEFMEYDIIIHGHMHEKKKRHHKFINLSVEHTGYKPVDIKRVVERW